MELFGKDTVWIGYDWHSDCSPLLNRYYAFRKSFCLEKAVSSAKLQITARARYVLWVNGKIVSCGPVRSYPENQPVDILDISDHLTVGNNYIAVLVHHPGRSTGQFINRGRPGLILQADITYLTGELKRVRTDSSWQIRYADWYIPVEAMITAHIGFQEHVDYGKEPAGWQIFEDNDQAWRKAWPYGKSNTYPSLILSARDIDFLVAEETPCALVFSGKFIPDDDVRPKCDNLRLKFESSRIIEAENACTENNGWYHLVSENKSAIILCFDLGQTMPIRPEIQLECKTDSSVEKVELYYSVNRTEGCLPSCDVGFGKEYEGAADMFFPKSEITSFETFGIRGFRFLSVVVYFEGKCKFKPIFKRVFHPVNENYFNCSDELLNKFWDVSKKTLRTCMLDCYVDCCNREQVMWIYDACVEGLAGFYTFGDTKLFRRSLRLVGQSALPNGVLRNMGPAEASFMILPDQTMTWIISLWDYYMLTADIEFLKEMEKPIVGFLEYCLENITNEGLFVPPLGAWHWIDWAYLDKRPYSLPVNALLFIAAHRANMIADKIAAGYLAELAKKIYSTISPNLARFYSPESCAFVDHIEPIDKSAIPETDTSINPLGWPADFDLYRENSCSIHANSLMLLAAKVDDGIITKDMATAALNCLIGLLEEDFNERNVFGPGWTDKIIGVLFDYGKAKNAIELLKKFYGHSLSGNAPTWGENFSTSPYNSAHGWGACINTILAKYVLGISPAEEGFEAINFLPDCPGVNFAKGSIMTRKGQADISWQRTGESMAYEVKHGGEVVLFNNS